jgi:poly(3-hydroxybutyrate) depolymerase/lysophospholipase L1-like esterase
MMLWKRVGIGVLAVSVLAGAARGDEAKPATQTEQAFEKEIKVKVKLNYLLFLPEGYGKGEKTWPLILFLHGAGESGDDLARVKTHGPPKIVEKKKDFPFIVVSPQSPRGGWNPDALNGLLEDVVARYKVDKDRIYLTGLSMGGFGTWALAAAHPERFAAIVPICGGGNPADAKRLKDLPIWVFHGAKDRVVPLARSEMMVKAIRTAGGKPKFTVYPEAGHDSWTETYNNPELYKWLLEHKRKSGKTDGSKPLKQARLEKGDRVVLLGNTLIEREQQYGYWETALTRLNPNKNIVFRNLGWSGDTVFGDARAGFGTVADGFRQLKEHVFANKPTVIVLGYGPNESFKGQAGLPGFVRGLDTLLDTLAETRARIVILSPLRQEDMGRPLPDPTEQNKNIRLYRDALRKAADKRGYPFVDLFERLGNGSAKPVTPLTDNGIHLSAYGYWKSAPIIADSFGLSDIPWRIEIDKAGKIEAQGTRVREEHGGSLRFQLTDTVLPTPLLQAYTVRPEIERVLRAQGLPPGKHVLKIDDKPDAVATAAEWVAGVRLTSGPEFDQVEKLRKAIVAKNLLYFHRWRPQNETYLFGFRKHEQGKNAREVVQFDPLIAKAEAEIGRLRVPVVHRYELVPQ